MSAIRKLNGTAVEWHFRVDEDETQQVEVFVDKKFIVLVDEIEIHVTRRHGLNDALPVVFLSSWVIKTYLLL